MRFFCILFLVTFPMMLSSQSSGQAAMDAMKRNQEILPDGESVYDTNDDGQGDKWLTVKGGSQTFQVDSDFDGQVDAVIRFAPSGAVIHESYDYNYDGQLDTFYFYGEEGMERQEIDTNDDGSIDLWIELHEGIYVKSTRQDLDFDGKVDEVKTYGNGETTE